MNTPQLLKLLKIAKLLKMLKLLRLVKIKQILMKFEENILSDSMDFMITIVKIFLKILVMAHYLACLLFYFGKEEFGNYGDSWINLQQLQNKSLIYQYITSLYWAFTTMAAVGYGDLYPVTKNEKVLVMGAMIMCCGMFAYTINNIGNIVSEYNKIASSYRERMMYVNKFMAQKEMPADLKLKVRRYLDYVFESIKEIKVDDNQVLTLLNENLREKIVMHLRGRIFKTVFFIEDFGLDFLSDLT